MHQLNQGIENLLRDQSDVELTDDLRKANEYDQIIWEEIQLDAYKNVGQIDNLYTIAAEKKNPKLYREFSWAIKDRGQTDQT
jgi:hypothetical protein